MSRIVRVLIVLYLPVALLAGSNEDMARYLQGEAAFTPNQGQLRNMDGKPANNVLAYYNTPGLQVYLTTKGITYVMQQFEEDRNAKPHPVFINEKKSVIHYSRVDVDLDGAQITAAQFQFADEEGWKSNYYKSADGKGQLGVLHYKTLTIKNIYPGIDWVWKCDGNKKLEYNCVVHAGADAGAIKMHYKYADLNPNTNKLLITAKYGTLAEGPLLANSMGEEVKIQYRYDKADKTIRFEAGNYNHSADLEIDPPLALQWSAQYGGSFNSGLRGVTTDTHGLIYMVGYTNSPDFPTFQSGSSYIDSTYNGGSDAVILKIDTGQHLLWSTFFGGPSDDYANSVAFDSSTGNVYVVGAAEQGFPLVILNGALNRTYFGSQDAFISLFNANLQLKWSTYFGDYQTDEALKIAIDSRAHNIFVTGYTDGGGSFPVVNNGYNQGGVAGGYDAFMLKFSSPAPNLCTLQWATFFGGSGDDYGTGLAIDSMHNVFLTGYTNSTNLPLANSGGYYQATNAGGYDGFIAKFGGNINSLSGSTYFGGSGDDYFTGISSRLDGSVMLTGYTTSTNFPLLNTGPSYFQNGLAGGSDAVITQFWNNLSLFWSTYYGGTDNDVGTGVATDKTGRLYVTGFTFSNNFPLQQASFPGSYYQPVNHGLSDGFLAGFGKLGQRFWSTYKGDTCYEYPNDIAYDTIYNKFYVVGENLLNCEGLPDTNQVNNNGSSSVGFCWSFVGPGIPQCSVGLIDTKIPCSINTCDGSEVAQLLSGAPPYTFLWSDNETSDTVSNLCSGGGWVEVTDSTGCVSDAMFVLVPLSAATGSEPNVCGSSNGKVWVDANGGTPPYGYQWISNNSTFDTITDLAAGIYTVQVDDADGCILTDSVMVTDSSYIPQLTNYVNNCDWSADGSGPSGANLGSAVIFPVNSGFAFPLSVQWSTGLTQTYLANNQNGETLNNLSDGNYSVTVTDANGCIYTNNFTINLLQWQELSLTVPCTNGDSIFLNYSYTSSDANTVIADWWALYAQSSLTQGQIYVGSWNTIGGVTDFSITWDNNSYCEVDTSLPFPFPKGFSDILYNPLPNANNCGNNQSLAVLITQEYSGYTASPFTYHWSNGETSDTIINLTPGVYNCTVTSNGCTAAATDTVKAVNPPVITNSLIRKSCGDGSNGSIALTLTGAGGYSYNWSNLEYAAIDTSLAPGVYSGTITDMNGCTVATTDTIGALPPIVVYESSQNPECYGDNTGQILITPTGGAGNYTYHWSNGEQTQDDNQLPAGTYYGTVTDQNDCTAKLDSIIIIQPPQIVVTDSTINPVCFNSTNGSILLDVSGGVPAYSYQWSNNESTDTDTNIGAGAYTYTVTDANGCTVTNHITLTATDSFTVAVNSANTTCFDSAKGSITLTASGGAGSYTYHWSNNAIGNMNLLLPAGNYACTITDANGCSVTKQFTISSPDSLSAFLSVQSTLCGSANGTVKLDSAYGGTAPYVLHWSNGSSNDSITNLSAGSYSLTITDDNGCVYTFSDSVPCVTGIANIVEDNLLVVYPNPASTIVYINSVPKQDYHLLLRDVTGRITVRQNFSQSLLLNIGGLARGVYMVEIYDKNSHVLAVKKLVLQ